MSQLPKNPAKIRERIKRYERELRQEHKRFGAFGDSAGKRYLMGPLYLLLGDNQGALKSFDWFEQNFPDDMGEPEHYLSWTLALYRSGHIAAAEQKLLQTMLSNLYLIPHLLGLDQPELDIWHRSNIDRRDYLGYIPPEILALWDDAALQWAGETYHNPKLSQVRERYIEIYRQLKDEPRGPKRSQLVQEAFNLYKLA
jgi:hypothetical protein